jgi:hypothetical protein
MRRLEGQSQEQVSAHTRFHVSVKYGYRPVGIRAEEVGLLLHM